MPDKTLYDSFCESEYKPRLSGAKESIQNYDFAEKQNMISLHWMALELYELECIKKYMKSKKAR